MKYKMIGFGLLAILMATLVFGAIKPHFHMSRGNIVVNPDIYSAYI